MVMDLATLQQQLPQLEVCCERLYNAQVRNAVCPLREFLGKPAPNKQSSLHAVQDPGERTSAEQSLKPFTSSTEYAPHLKVRAPNGLTMALAPTSSTPSSGRSRLLQTILDNSVNPYAQCFASSSLLTMVTEQAVRYALKAVGKAS
jgi:hypothetical protein